MERLCIESAADTGKPELIGTQAAGSAVVTLAPSDAGVDAKLAMTAQLS